MFVRLQTLAKHVMSIHMNAQQISNEPREGELDLRTLKKFIAFCRRFHIFFLLNIFNNFALSSHVIVTSSFAVSAVRVCRRAPLRSCRTATC